MDYLEIVNWKRWQTYRQDRPDWQPTWIKLHRCLLRNPEWITLSDSQRGQLVSIWVLAADYGGRIPDNEPYLERVLCLSKKLHLEVFIELGFIKPRVTSGNQVSDKRGLLPGSNRIEQKRKEKNKKEPRAPTADGSAPDDAVYVTFPTNITGVECPIFASQVKSWKTTFPAVDVEQQIRESRQWCIDNPTKRKTYSGVSRYIYNWLSRRQNAGGSSVARAKMTPDEHLKQIEGRSAK